MRMVTSGGMLLVLVCFLGAPDAAAEGPAVREPGPKAKGKRYQWKSADGLVYEYRVPKSYDPKQGAGLTLILHGSNLDRRWGFANHSDKTFRPDDIVVSPDGTTSRGRGGFNFLGERKDAKRLHALLEELRALFNIRAVYLYGHSQGSFFALYYAGEYPEEVDGVVAQASGVWTWTKQRKQGRHQAIVLMHGTQDPVVPYGQSVGGYESYVKAGYPLVRLRSLEGWNHWPAEHNQNLYGQAVPNASQQLAWVEGMTTDDPERLAICFEFLADTKFRERHDYAGTYTLAKRVEAQADAPKKLRDHATKVAAAIEKLAQAHVDAIGKTLPARLALEKKAWLGHMLMFLRAFDGVPAHAEFAKAHERSVAKSAKAGLGAMRRWWKARNKGDDADAFRAGMDAIADGYCFHECANYEFLKALQALHSRAKELKFGKQALKTYASVVPVFQATLQAGQKAFDGINKKQGKLP